MFTGIIEAIGTIKQIEEEGTNVHITVASPLSSALTIDQSVAHNGVCLTVVSLSEGAHTVTAIAETLQKTSLKYWKVGQAINLERAMGSGALFDGHIVQGHVDGVGVCQAIEEMDGSWYFIFGYQHSQEHLLVDKGSICVDGVSLTVVSPTTTQFKVAIIPYTYEHTVFSTLQVGTPVNLEFDIIGKYIGKHIQAYLSSLPLSKKPS